MASKNQGRDDNLPDSAALRNVGGEFAFPLLHSEVSQSGIMDTDFLSLLQLQVSPSPTGNCHGQPAHYVGHASAGSLISMMSNAAQDSNLLMSSVHDPLSSGGVFAAENNDITSASAMNRRQSYNLNHNVQMHGVSPVIGSNLQLDTNRSPINIGGGPGILRHGSDNWVMPGASLLDSSKLDGSFLSLGHEDSVASAGECNGSRLYYPPFRQEISHGPFNPSEFGGYGSNSQNLVQSGSNGRFTLSHNDDGTIPCLTSGFNVSPSLPSLGQHIEVTQFMAAANGRSPVMGDHMNSRYTNTGSNAYQTFPSGLYTNSQLTYSGSGGSWMSSLPSEAVSASTRQKSTALENQGINLTSDAVLSSQSPTYFPTTSSRKAQPDQASQERIMRAPPSESYNVVPINSDQPVSASSRSMYDKNVVHRSSLKRVPSFTTDVPPRKLIRQHNDSPSRFHINPSQPQNSLVNRNPSSSLTFTNISKQQLLHPSFWSPETPSLQNTSANMVPAFTPFANNSFSINPYPKTIPNSSSAFSNTTQSPLHPSFVPQAQTAHFFQKVSASMPTARPLNPSLLTQTPLNSSLKAQAPLNPSLVPQSPINPSLVPQPFYRHSIMSTNGSCSSSTFVPKVVQQPSIAPIHGAANGKPSPVFGATGNRSLAISAKKMPTTEGHLGKTYSSVVRRFIERQSSALAAYENKQPGSGLSVKTSSMPHIKWQGFEKSKESGFKCLLCKRDLAYAPEGPVSIPAIPPKVVVLPCGHVFHDHCFVAITPHNQQTDPLCIPCSLGEPVV